jgi:hypothetical protein
MEREENERKESKRKWEYKEKKRWKGGVVGF